VGPAAANGTIILTGRSGYPGLCASAGAAKRSPAQAASTRAVTSVTLIGVPLGSRSSRLRAGHARSTVPTSSLPDRLSHVATMGSSAAGWHGSSRAQRKRELATLAPLGGQIAVAPT